MTDTFNQIQKVSALIAEVRPYFLAKKEHERKKMQKIKALCAVFVFVLVLALPRVYNLGYDMLICHNLSAQDLGFPTDEYGLILVE